MDDKEEYVISTLREVKKELDRENVVFWLDSGGLLGAVREGRLIPWDHDIEIGVWEEELPKVLKAVEKLKDKGFVIDYLLCKGGENSIIISKDFTRKIPLVIEIHKRVGNKSYSGMLGGAGGEGRLRRIFRRGLKHFYSVLSSPHTVGSKPPYIPYSIHILIYKFLWAIGDTRVELLRKFMDKYLKFMGFKWVFNISPAYYFDNFDTVEFYGMNLRVPSPVEKYLEYRYGKDWKIPKKDWSSFRDDGGLKHLRKI